VNVPFLIASVWFNLLSLPESQAAVALECAGMVCTMYDSGKSSLKSENEQRTIIAHSGCHHPPHHGQWLDGTGPPRKKGGVETQSGTQCQVLLRPKSPRDLTSTSTLCRLQLDSKQNTKSTQNLKHLSYSETSFVASNWHIDYVHKTLAAELQQKWK
jgi:hypothetical protein